LTTLPSPKKLRGSNSWSNFPATISCPALRRSFSNSGTRRSPVHRPDVNARNRLWRSYCLRTADKALDVWYGRFPLLRLFQVKRRADERTRTADLLQLRVIGQWLLRVARVCKSRISKPVSIFWLAARCPVFRSLWCLSGVKSTYFSRRSLYSKPVVVYILPIRRRTTPG
jgi:hypothetical protein